MAEQFDVVQRIQDASHQLRNAASELTNRVAWFENWLGNLPGRVAAHTSMGADPDDNVEKFLELARDGKEWSLYVYEVDLRSEQRSNRVLLRDSSIAVKAVSIQYFKDLLTQIYLQQKMLLAVSENATKNFDEFVKTLPAKEGK